MNKTRYHKITVYKMRNCRENESHAKTRTNASGQCEQWYIYTITAVCCVKL